MRVFPERPTPTGADSRLSRQVEHIVNGRIGQGKLVAQICFFEMKMRMLKQFAYVELLSGARVEVRKGIYRPDGMPQRKQPFGEVRANKACSSCD